MRADVFQMHRLLRRFVQQPLHGAGPFDIKDGSLIPYDSGSEEPLYYFDPREALFVGGQFNGAGYATNRRRSTAARSRDSA